MVDTTKLDGPRLLEHCGRDAAKWAEAFNQHAVKLGYSDMELGWLIAWFANAMMAQVDYGKGPLCGDHADYLLAQQQAQDANYGTIL